MILQLNPQIPVLTEKGPAQAIFLIDYSEEHDLKWVVFLDHDGSCWTFPNSKVRAFENYSMNRVFNADKMSRGAKREGRKRRADKRSY